MRKKGFPKFATDSEKLAFDIEASTSEPFGVDQDSEVPSETQIENEFQKRILISYIGKDMADIHLRNNQ